ncbi:MAG: FAD binding domain-containing protein [Pirellulales bacterium]|nr:FAD binding domain-containing protein [Pirellulales bacterium]
MKAFEYAAPRRESEIAGLLSSRWGESEILAGGTDLVGLMYKMVVTPSRVVNIMDVPSLRGVEADSQSVRIGATTSLSDLLDSPDLDDFPSIKQAIRGISSLQLQAQGTLGGELCQRPRCWYFRNGHGYLAQNGRLVAEGDHRYHAIFGNAGPAKFCAGSRLAPALMALGAKVRVVGPGPEDEAQFPLDALYRTPRDEQQRETVLLPNQVLTHITIPRDVVPANATYEVRQGAGPDYPLASAAAAVQLKAGRIIAARVVLGQVAPVPWVSSLAANVLLGQLASREAAAAAGEAAVREATPLPGNRYKVQLARVAVERAALLAFGLQTGGF